MRFSTMKANTMFSVQMADESHDERLTNDSNKKFEDRARSTVRAVYRYGCVFSRSKPDNLFLSEMLSTKINIPKYRNAMKKRQRYGRFETDLNSNNTVTCEKRR